MCRSEGHGGAAAQRRRVAQVLAGTLTLACAAAIAQDAASPDEAARPRPVRTAAAERCKDRFPNIKLYTQDGQAVRFYDDLIRDRIVLVYFMFTTCKGICPATTANMVRCQDLLGERFGDDVFFVAVTLTPEIDTPAVLKAYAESYGTRPGWTFVTGDKAEIEDLRRKMGVFDPDPVIDADLYSHAGLVTFGNESTGRWSALPGTLPPKQIVEALQRRTRPARPAAVDPAPPAEGSGDQSPGEDGPPVTPSTSTPRSP